MKKNGFTLIELLAAIIVLGIISLIVFPTIDRTIKNQKKKLYDRQVQFVASEDASFITRISAISEISGLSNCSKSFEIFFSSL